VESGIQAISAMASIGGGLFSEAIQPMAATRFKQYYRCGKDV